MRKIYINRLLKLAKHLRSGKLAHKRFNFTHYNNGSFDGNSCGTSGCAIGEAPVVWPKLFEWKRHLVFAKEDSTGYVCDDFCRFFGLRLSGYEKLFIPYSLEYNKSKLSTCATAVDVAEHIEKFCVEASRRRSEKFS